MQIQIPKVETLERRFSKRIKLMEHEPVKLVQVPNEDEFEEKSVLETQPMRLGFYGGIFQSKIVAFFGNQAIRREDAEKVQVELDQLKPDRRVEKIAVHV